MCQHKLCVFISHETKDNPIAKKICPLEDLDDEFQCTTQYCTKVLVLTYGIEHEIIHLQILSFWVFCIFLVDW